MPSATSNWEQRLSELWTSFDGADPERFLRDMQALVGELSHGDAIGAFETACAHDSTGRSDLAVPLYRAALAAGLTGIRRRRATIQLASSLRNIGQAGDAVA